MNILSLFDGMSCGQIALNRAVIKVSNYFASEIDKHAIKVTQANYPNTVQLGDVTKWREWSLPQIDLLIGGSPCQGFSFAGKQLAFDDPRSKLFFEFVECLKHFKPKYFLLENVRMKKEHMQVITDMLGVEPIMINSALVSAQNRVRFYWTNIPEVEQPDDLGIVLQDILESEVEEKYYLGGAHKEWLLKNMEFQLSKKYSAINPDKAITMVARQYASWAGNFVSAAIRGRYVQGNTVQVLETRSDSKANALTQTQKTSVLLSRPRGNNLGGMSEDKSPTVSSSGWQNNIALLQAGEVRKLTPVECERLQTVPDNYTAVVSDNQRYKMLGNGWTVDVVAHIFKNIPNKILNDEEQS